MKPEYYPDIKRLMDTPEWGTYQKLLKDRMQIHLNSFMSGAANIAELQFRVLELTKILQMPTDLVKEFEAKEK